MFRLSPLATNLIHTTFLTWIVPPLTPLMQGHNGHGCWCKLAVEDLDNCFCESPWHRHACTRKLSWGIESPLCSAKLIKSARRQLVTKEAGRGHEKRLLDEDIIKTISHLTPHEARISHLVPVAGPTFLISFAIR